jgi:hypothetical protein
MRRFQFFPGVPFGVFLLTAVACSSGSENQPSSTGGSVGGAESGGTSGSSSGGAGGNTVVSPGTGGATGTTPLGGSPATGGSSQPGGSGGASSGGAGAGSGGSASGGSTTATGGATATGGTSGRGGSGGTASGGAGSGGSAGGGSGTASGGATATGGTSGRGGAGGSATGGARAGGATGPGGAVGSGGVSGTGGSSTDGGTPSTCGTGTTPAANPFGCTFAWGVNGNPASYLQFASAWAGYNIKADGTFPTNGFDSGNWLKSFTTAVPAYYAYIIGYYGHANGLQDGNVNPGQPNLTNGMGPLLLGVDNAACPSGTICDQNLMVKAYAWYAAQTYAAYKKPVIWLLEGDFIQYSVEGSSSGLSYAQLGQLAAQITLAIKCNDPPAVVAIDYSGWISASQLTSYIGGINTAMAALGTSYDMIWTTGQGSSASPGTSTYANLHTVTGKTILVDESFGLSAQGDTWANQTAATINARIAGGVVAANITTATPSYLQTNLTSTLAPSALNSTCP